MGRGTCGRPHKRTLGFVALMALTGVAGQGLGAPPQGPTLGLEALIGLPITGLRISPSSMSLDELEGLLGDPVGAPLTRELLRAIVERLYRLGRFRGVVVRGQEEDGGVSLRVHLDPVTRIRGMDIRGAGPVGQGWVRQALGRSDGDEIDPRDLPDLRLALEEALKRRGFRTPTVRVELEVTRSPEWVRLEVDLETGPKTRLRQVVLRGWLPFPNWQLDLGVKPGEVLDLERVGPALRALESKLRRDGHFDARVEKPAVVLLPGRRRSQADVVLEVDPGPAVEVRIEGNHRVARSRLEEDAAALSELGSGASALVEVQERILARYERLGHFRAQVEVAGRTSIDRRRRQVLFKVDEGPASRVIGIGFLGAGYFKDDVLRAQVLETVERFLAPYLSRPGVDPEVVERSFRGRPTPLREQPSTAPPNPRRVYVPRAYRAAVETIADLYRSEGFQSVKVSDPQLSFRGEELIEVEYRIEEGLRWRVSALDFPGRSEVPVEDLERLVAFEPSPTEEGEPLVFDRVDEARRAIEAYYRNRGYAFASVRVDLHSSARPEDAIFSSSGEDLAAHCAESKAQGESSCAVAVSFPINEGPRVRVRKVYIPPAPGINSSAIRGEIELEEGKYLRAKDLEATRDNLLRLGVFDRVEVSMVDEERVATEKDVAIQLVPRASNALELGFGASTEEGLRVFASFSDRNLFGTLVRLQTNAKVNLWGEPLLSVYDEALQEQIRSFYRPLGVLGSGPILLIEFELAAGISYPRIFFLPRGFSFGLDLIVLRDYDPAFEENNQRLTLIGTYEGFRPRILGRRRPMVLQLRANLERAELNCNDAVDARREDLCSSGVSINNQGDRTEGENVYFSVGPRFSWDFRDNPLDPGSGVYLELEGEFAEGLDDQSPDYVGIEGRVNFYAPVAPRATFVTSFRGGRIFPLTSQVPIPLNRRFYAGGRSTIRGYPEKTLLPQDVPLDENGLPISDISTGGLLYLALKTEIRILIANPVSLAGFFDIGDLWALTDQDSQCPTQGFNLITTCALPDGRTIRRRLAQGAGFGLRVATPIGPLAVDMGFPVNRRDPAVEDWTLHFSVGAF